jgi:hypothetical protein
MASLDKYRSYLGEEEVKHVQWKFGSPPNYDVVNKLFEEGQTKVWPKGSVEEKVQNLVKTWEMEIFHKVRLEDLKTFDPNNFSFSVNGRKGMTIQEVAKIGGGYNAFLQTSLPENLRGYDSTRETADSSHIEFTTTFPRGFAVEIIEVYSGPPVIVYKFRHWGYMEGPFKGHPPTGEIAQFFGLAIFHLDEESKIVKVEFFYDRGELLASLMKNSICDSTISDASTSTNCPFLKTI